MITNTNNIVINNNQQNVDEMDECIAENKRAEEIKKNTQIVQDYENHVKPKNQQLGMKQFFKRKRDEKIEEKEKAVD